MKIGVIGGGVVGSATAAAWRGHRDEVRVYDTDPARRTVDEAAWALVCDVIFVCLPENVVENFFAEYVAYLGSPWLDKNFVLRSTIPVGTTRRLAERYGLPNLVHSPEFLTERTATEDAANPRLNVIGVVNRDPGWLVTLYRHRWPEVKLRVMISDASELMKLALNGFFSNKVSYWNEVESYCRAAGIDYETVRAACVAEGRVGDLHTHVPGPDGKRGFGGRCLPKDLRQLIECFDAAGVRHPVLNAVEWRNKTIDRAEDFA